MSGRVLRAACAGIAPEELEAALRRAMRCARDDAEASWLAVRVELPGNLRPIAAFAAGHEQDRFLWSIPDDGIEIVGRGAAHSLELSGRSRFADADAFARTMRARTVLCGAPGPRECGPILVAGFAFADRLRENAWLPGAREWAELGNARLFAPRLSWTRTGDTHRGCATLEIAPGAGFDALECELHRALGELLGPFDRPDGSLAGPASSSTAAEFRARADRSHEHYCLGVDRALSAIGLGDLEKVVLARSVSLESGGPLALEYLLESLRERHPTSATFAIAHGAHCFVGATPERLVALEGDRVRTAAVAGSAARGRSPEEDEALGTALVLDKKEQAEHAIVVREIRRALADVCSDLEGPEAPRLLRLDAIQHLETPLTGKLSAQASADGVTLLQLAERLHPTPAVGGTPREAALRWIDENEELERGWYGGPVGWLGLDGGGELRVALRSALLDLDRRRARLYAGAGIVAGSVPERELCETRLKLRTLLAPLMEM